MLERATRLCRTSPQIATTRPFELAAAPPDGERVEQRLGRMFVAAVAGIDHAAIELARQQLRCAGILMAHDKDVRPHGVQRRGGVDQRLALGDRRGLAPTCSVTSAPSRLPASSNELCVRVEASKNRLMSVRPLSRGDFFSLARLSATYVVGQVEQGR